jgi:signal transduction histidine kinase
MNNERITEDMRQGVMNISDTLHTSINAVRDLSYDLRPPGLEKLGLVHAIAKHCKDFSLKSGVHVDFTSAGMDNIKFGFDTKINLYRVIQESLNNTWRHANAEKVVVRLVSSHPNIILRIEDNGKGFDTGDHSHTVLKGKRMGLRSMEERIKLLQGTLNIQSRSKKGTKILIEVPIHGKGNQEEDRHSDH